jgi:hypothetical protein
LRHTQLGTDLAPKIRIRIRIRILIKRRKKERLREEGIRGDWGEKGRCG